VNKVFATSGRVHTKGGVVVAVGTRGGGHGGTGVEGRGTLDKNNNTGKKKSNRR